jgi:hypothetical protein
MSQRKFDRRSFLKKSTAITAAAFSYEEAALLAYQQQQPPRGGEPPAGRGAEGALPPPRGGGRSSIPAPVGAGPMPMGSFGGMKVSRLIFGHDIITGIAHSGELIYVSGLIRAWFTDEKILQTFQKAEEMGINTQFLRIDERNVRLAKQYRKERGGKLQYIAQCSLNQGDVKRDADFALEAGATHMYIIGTQTDSMIQNGTFTDVVPKALEYFKQNKVYCGLAAHSLEVAMTAEKLKLPTDFYVKTFHSPGYWSAGLQKVPRDPNFKPTDKQMIQPEYGIAEFRHDNLWESTPEATKAFFEKLNKPWIAYKVLAAGRLHPRDGFEYALANGADYMVVGMYDFQIEENVKYLKDFMAKDLKRTRPWIST